MRLPGLLLSSVRSAILPHGRPPRAPLEGGDKNPAAVEAGGGGAAEQQTEVERADLLTRQRRS
jgi:hypothetical protein